MNASTVAASVAVVPVPNAPPAADPLAATTDLYFVLPNPNFSFSPGERLNVTLALAGEDKALHVPWQSVLHDVNGSAWVYENTAPLTFVRRRVEVRAIRNGMAILAQGPKPGVKVVTAGAAELFGTEFGAGK